MKPSLNICFEPFSYQKEGEKKKNVRSPKWIIWILCDLGPNSRGNFFIQVSISITILLYFLLFAYRLIPQKPRDIVMTMGSWDELRASGKKPIFFLARRIKNEIRNI